MLEEMKAHGFADTSPAILTGLINDAYQDLCSQELWPFLMKDTTVTLTAGNDVLPGVADCRAVKALVIPSQGVTLTPVDPQELLQNRTAALSSEGMPSLYYFTAGQIRVWPVPDTSYDVRVRYVRVPADLSGIGDAPILPARHHRVVVLGALVAAYTMEDDPELAAQFQNLQMSRISRMREDLHTEQVDRPQTIRITDPDNWYSDGWGY